VTPDPSTAPFGTIQREAVPQQIVTRLQDLIRQRHLGPGDRLPSERELAQSMAVSRSSLREALRALSVMGVLEMRHGEGTFITSLEPELLVRHLGFVLSLSEGAFDDLFAARVVVEPAIAAMAASNADDAGVARLEECLQAGLAARDDQESFLEADLQLHRIVCDMARNPILDQFMRSIATLAVASRRETVSIPGVIESSISEHIEIVAAIRARDSEAARAGMARHLERLRRQQRTHPIA
jgi:DNA-binding FadR family transcriptional regulator